VTHAGANGHEGEAAKDKSDWARREAHDAGGRGAELLDKGGLRLVADGERSDGRGGGLR